MSLDVFDPCSSLYIKYISLSFLKLPDLCLIPWLFELLFIFTSILPIIDANCSRKGEWVVPWSCLYMKLIFNFILIRAVFLSTSIHTLTWCWIILSFFLISLNLVKAWNHVFLILLNLEILGLIFIASLSSLAFLTHINRELFFIFFTFAVCEASLGIAILIFFSHAKGNESIYSLLNI